MEVITSRDNQLVKKLIKLKDKKYRAEYGEFVVEGERWIVDAIKNGETNKIVNIVVSSDKLDCFPSIFSSSGEFKAEGLNGKLSLITAELMQKVTETVSSCGILIVYKFLAPKTKTPSCERCLALDRIRDPGNLGMILRSAAACGFSDVVLNDSVDVYNPKTIRSCMTGILYLNLYFDISILELKKLGYKTIAADMDGKNVFGFTETSGKLCLIIGNEATGISSEVKNNADFAISLPMKNVESLNAGACATTLMYLLMNK